VSVSDISYLIYFLQPTKSSPLKSEDSCQQVVSASQCENSVENFHQCMRQTVNAFKLNHFNEIKILVT